MLLLALILAQTPQHRLFQQPNLPRGSYAFFEAFPASGAGTSGPCSTTAPTGAKGEALTFTRASAATCTRTASGGLATTGISDGDLISVSTNVARVEYDSAGTLGLLVESARTNVLLRYIELANAAWADVGTPTLTGSLADPFGGTAGVSIDDNDGAASEGRSQSVTVSAGAAYFMHCYVKAGTRAEATISIDGTTQAITGLSATTWSIVEKADASSSGVSIPIQVLVGDAVGDTGTVIWGGCQVEAGTYRTSIIPTTSAAVTRAKENASINGATFPVTAFSKAATVTVPWATATSPGTWSMLIGEVGVASGSDLFGLSGTVRTQNCSGSCTNITSASQTITAGVAVRFAASQSSGLASIFKDGTSITGPSALTAPASPWSTTTGIGDDTAGLGHLNGIISRICVDPSPERCR